MTILSRPQVAVTLTSLWTGEAERVGTTREDRSACLSVLAWQLSDIQTPQSRLVDQKTRDVEATENFFLIQ